MHFSVGWYFCNLASCHLKVIIVPHPHHKGSIPCSSQLPFLMGSQNALVTSPSSLLYSVKQRISSERGVLKTSSSQLILCLLRDIDGEHLPSRLCPGVLVKCITKHLLALVSSFPLEDAVKELFFV